MSERPIIYLITCSKTGEKYVGSAHHPRRRFIEHRYWLKRGMHHSYKFQKCYNDNGIDSFQYSTLEIVINANEIYTREQFWIDTIKPELNVALDVEHPSVGYARTPETISQMRQSRLEFHARMSPEQKVEHKIRISEGIKEWRDSLTDEEKLEANKRRSHPHTEETKRILSEMSKVNNPRRGKKFPGSLSPETKEKLRQVNQPRWDAARSEKARKRAEWELGRAEREIARVKKVRIANTGKKRTLEHKEHLRQVALAQQQDPEYKARHEAGLLAVMQTPEMREKLSKAHKGKKLSAEHRANIGKAGRGKKRSEESKKRLSDARRKWWAERKLKKGK